MHATKLWVKNMLWVQLDISASYLATSQLYEVSSSLLTMLVTLGQEAAISSGEMPLPTEQTWQPCLAKSQYNVTAS